MQHQPCETCDHSPALPARLTGTIKYWGFATFLVLLLQQPQKNYSPSKPIHRKFEKMTKKRLDCCYFSITLSFCRNCDAEAAWMSTYSRFLLLPADMHHYCLCHRYDHTCANAHKHWLNMASWAHTHQLFFFFLLPSLFH